MPERCEPMVFRKWSDGNILALMPCIPADNYGKYCQSYEHIGQHAGADYHSCIKDTAPATPDEYKELYDELIDIGYKIQPVLRASQKMHKERLSVSRCYPGKKI